MQAANARPLQFSIATLLDWGERLAVCALFSALVVSKIAAHETGWFFYLYCLSEGLVVLFIIARRGADSVTVRPLDWALAIVATLLPMLAKGGGEGLINPNVGVMVFLVGLSWQVWAKLILRRSFGIVAANRGVKRTGPYRYMRHPMYFGYLLTHIGLFLTSPIGWNVAIYGLAWAAQIARILAEERLLGADKAYADYAKDVRFRLIPFVF
jgi:protein-S-isoprenylcysteine O-methyltransferase Ste14